MFNFRGVVGVDIVVSSNRRKGRQNTGDQAAESESPVFHLYLDPMSVVYCEGSPT